MSVRYRTGSFQIHVLAGLTPSGGKGISQNLVSNLTYFSSVTLTTLGYGDIVPVSRPARMFATLEATIGQLYIAIVIARLVGLHISQHR